MSWPRWTSPAGVRMSILSGRPSIDQTFGTHGPTPTMTCSTSMSPWSVWTAGDRARAVAVEPGHGDALDDPDALRARLVGDAVHRVDVEGEAAAVLVQDDRDPLRPPVREEPAHVGRAGRLAGDEGVRVADSLLARGDLGQVGLLPLRAERHVADRVVVIRRRVGLPHLDVRGHQLATSPAGSSCCGRRRRRSPTRRPRCWSCRRSGCPRPIPRRAPRAPWRGGSRSTGRGRPRRSRGSGRWSAVPSRELLISSAAIALPVDSGTWYAGPRRRVNW